MCVRPLPDLCYSPSIVKPSVEQDPDPLVGTNQTHSSGLNGQLTKKGAIVALSACASQLKGFELDVAQRVCECSCAGDMITAIFCCIFVNAYFTFFVHEASVKGVHC